MVRHGQCSPANSVHTARSQEIHTQGWTAVEVDNATTFLEIACNNALGDQFGVVLMRARSSERVTPNQKPIECFLWIASRLIGN